MLYQKAEIEELWQAVEKELPTYTYIDFEDAIIGIIAGLAANPDAVGLLIKLINQKTKELVSDLEAIDTLQDKPDQNICISICIKSAETSNQITCAWCFEPIKKRQAWFKFVKDYIHISCIDEIVKLRQKAKKEEGDKETVEMRKEHKEGS